MPATSVRYVIFWSCPTCQNACIDVCMREDVVRKYMHTCAYTVHATTLIGGGRACQGNWRRECWPCFTPRYIYILFHHPPFPPPLFLFNGPWCLTASILGNYMTSNPCFQNKKWAAAHFWWKQIFALHTRRREESCVCQKWARQPPAKDVPWTPLLRRLQSSCMYTQHTDISTCARVRMLY